MKRLSIVLALIAVLAFAAVSFAQESEGDAAAPETPTAPGWQMRTQEDRPGIFGRMAENLRERMMQRFSPQAKGDQAVPGPFGRTWDRESMPPMMSQMMRRGGMHPGMTDRGMMGKGMTDRGMMGEGLMDRDAHLAAVAEALEMSVEELEEAITSGTPIYELAAEAGVDLHAVMSGLMTERIQAAVEAGDLTQEQADAMLERMESHPGPMMHGQRNMPGKRGR
jgi:hypothetical protein